MKIDIWNNLELGWGIYDILKMLHAAKSEVSVCEIGGFGFHGSDSNLSRYFHHILLGFSDSSKGLYSTTYIYM
jgi:hypothetical protein